jgi:predicted metal-dependent hydrolase
VKLLGRHLHVWTPTPRLKPRVRALVDHWYREHAKKILGSRVEYCYQQVKRFRIPAPNLRIKRMRKRWGSCTRSAIILNTELIKVPLQCIDYVIVHELCHLRIPGHDSRFFRLLTTCMPNWQHRKRRLDLTSLEDY